MSGARNVKGGLILLSGGLAAGLAMSAYAFQPMVPVPPGLRTTTTCRAVSFVWRTSRPSCCR